MGFEIYAVDNFVQKTIFLRYLMYDHTLNKNFYIIYLQIAQKKIPRNFFIKNMRYNLLAVTL